MSMHVRVSVHTAYLYEYMFIRIYIVHIGNIYAYKGMHDVNRSPCDSKVRQNTLSRGVISCVTIASVRSSRKYARVNDLIVGHKLTLTYLY